MVGSQCLLCFDKLFAENLLHVLAPTLVGRDLLSCTTVTDIEGGNAEVITRATVQIEPGDFGLRGDVNFLCNV